MTDAAFAAAVSRALIGARRGVFPAATVTAIVADPADPERLGLALERLLEFLPRAGVPRGRALVLLAAGAPEPLARALRAVLGIPVIAHHPGRSACFTAGRAGGVAIEVNDELREAEAVLALGPLASGAEPRTLHALVVPGLASAASRAGMARAPDQLDAARALVPLDLAVGWWAGPDGGWDVRAD